MKRIEVKSKGEKEKYKHLNAEFQRIARRDKKAFFSNQCKEREENNRMGKTRDLFKKIRDTSSSSHLPSPHPYPYLILLHSPLASLLGMHSLRQGGKWGV